MINEDAVVIDTKSVHSGHLHRLATTGGTIIFPNFPFGINFVGDGSAYLKVQLVTVPQGKVLQTYTAPTIPKKAKVKPVPVENDIDQDDDIEM